MQPKTPPLNLVAIRQRYQKALLTWLKEPEANNGLRQMRAVLGAVALIQPPEFVGFWRDAEALIQALVDAKFPADAELRKLASKLDSQFKQLVRENPVPDKSLWEEIRAVLNRLNKPTGSLALDANHPLADLLAKTASILPFVAQSQLPRFSEEVSAAWNAATLQLLEAWDRRYQDGWGTFRSAVFGLCGAALTVGEPAFFRFSEALASAMDRVDDEIEPPAHLVAAMAAPLERMAELDFLEHAALYTRLELFAARLEKVVEEEIRVARAVQGIFEPEPEFIQEVRVPQPGFEKVEEDREERSPQSIYDYLNSLSVNPVQKILSEPSGVFSPADNPAALDEVVLQPLTVGEEGLQVDSIPAAQIKPVLEKKPLADAQLLARVARDLEALAESLHLSGLARQAGELASLVDRIDQAEIDQDEVRADLLQVIQFMQDQVGAVVMGFPPHANPKITDLMQKLENTLDSSAR
ncbi:MAG: hypothetical protein RIR18_969 [Pseudomonadota bacterium]